MTTSTVTYWLPIDDSRDFEHLDDARIYAHHLHRTGNACAPITIRAYDPETGQSADVESFIPAAF